MATVTPDPVLSTPITPEEMRALIVSIYEIEEKISKATLPALIQVSAHGTRSFSPEQMAALIGGHPVIAEKVLQVLEGEACAKYHGEHLEDSLEAEDWTCHIEIASILLGAAADATKALA